MKLKIPILFPILLCTGLIPSSAQDNYLTDSTFFRQQIFVYQDWLERQNLSAYFTFQEEPIKISETRLQINLKFQVEGIDASVNAIRQLNDKYQPQTGFTLEESLFQKAIHLFEIPPGDLRIKVESILTNGDPPGVSSLLRYRKNSTDKTFIITPFSFLRSEVKDSVIIQDFEVPENLLLPLELGVDDRDYRKKEQEICDYIKSKTANLFSSKGVFFFSYPIATNTINFGVKNLKNEVIEKGLLSIFDPYEKLLFTVKVIPSGQNGLRFLVKIDGKYGPGLYKPRSSDYHDMDPKYKAALEEYTQRFAREKIRNWIIKY